VQLTDQLNRKLKQSECWI